MSVPINTKDSFVIMHDEKTGETIAKAPILKHDKAHHRITVAGKYFKPNVNPRVSMLLIDEVGILECLGVIRQPDFDGNREIAIFNIKSRENRESVRYAVDTPATIDSITNAKNEPLPLDVPLDVTIENISTSGVLITTTSSLLNKGFSFHLSLEIQGSPIVIETSVVRVVNTNENFRKLGCSFSSIL